MIRFSAFLVVVAVGLLVAGVVTSKLLLVYIAIGVSGVALLALGIGAAVNWRELTSKTAQPGTVESSAQGPAAPQTVVPEPASAPAVAGAAPAGPGPTGSGWPVTAPSAPSGPSRAGYLPATEPPPRARPAAAAAPAAFTPRREPPAPGVWEWRDDSLQTPAPPTSPQPTQKPAPSGAEPSPAAKLDQPPAMEQPSAAGKPESEPAPKPKVAGDPKPASDAGSISGSELTLVPGIALEQPEQPEQPKQVGQAEPADPDPAMEVTVVPGVPRYHKARCILIRFMGDSDLDKMTLAAAREAGCTPCRACLPDQPGKSPE